MRWALLTREAGINAAKKEHMCRGIASRCSGAMCTINLMASCCARTWQHVHTLMAGASELRVHGASWLHMSWGCVSSLCLPFSMVQPNPQSCPQRSGEKKKGKERARKGWKGRDRIGFHRSLQKRCVCCKRLLQPYHQETLQRFWSALTNCNTPSGRWSWVWGWM
eukprot:scaffold153448_cov15-Tisochrysis_lutea.AAC.1